MRTGRIHGIQLVLNHWFLGLILLFTLMGLGGKVLVVFSAVLFHELAHALTAMALDFTVREIELLPFGGVARIDGLGQAGSGDEIKIAAAGPAASLVLAAVVYLSMQKLIGWGEFLEFYYEVNVMLALFNLIPALPLDGGRILRAYLARQGNYSRATHIVVRISYILCLILVGLAGYSYLSSGTINLTLFIAAVFLYVAGKKEQAVAGFRTLRLFAHKKAKLQRQGLMMTRQITALETARVKDVVQCFQAEYYYMVVVVDGKLRFCGMITETKIWEELPERGLYSRIGDLI